MESDTTTQPALGNAAQSSGPAQEAATTTREARRGGSRDEAQAGAPGQGAQANGADGQLAFAPGGAAAGASVTEAGQAANGAGDGTGRAEGQQDAQRRGERRQRGRRDDSSRDGSRATGVSSARASVTVTSATAASVTTAATGASATTASATTSQRSNGRDGQRGGQVMDRGGDDDDDGSGRRRSRDRFRNRNRRREGRGGPEAEPVVAEDDVLIPIAGILDVLDNYGFIRTTGYLPGSNDVYVSLSQVRRHGLRKGDVIEGAVRQPRDGERRRSSTPWSGWTRSTAWTRSSPAGAPTSPSWCRCTRRTGSGWRPTPP